MVRTEVSVICWSSQWWILKFMVRNVDVYNDVIWSPWWSMWSSPQSCWHSSQNLSVFIIQFVHWTNSKLYTYSMLNPWQSWYISSWNLFKFTMQSAHHKVCLSPCLHMLFIFVMMADEACWCPHTAYCSISSPSVDPEITIQCCIRYMHEYRVVKHHNMLFLKF